MEYNSYSGVPIIPGIGSHVFSWTRRNVRAQAGQLERFYGIIYAVAGQRVAVAPSRLTGFVRLTEVWERKVRAP